MVVSPDRWLIDALAEGAVLLEDRISDNPSGWLYRRPLEIVSCAGLEELDSAFDRLERALDQGLHAAGLFSYELGYAFEPKLHRLLADRPQQPLILLGIFEKPEILLGEMLDAAFAGLGPPKPIRGLPDTSDQETHTARLRQVLDFIASGDIYQANLTFQRHFDYTGDPLKLYAALRALQPVAHGGFVRMGGTTLLSVSPELWVDVAGDRATMRPMKGTVTRGADAISDTALAQALGADPKQQAENLMIVDLLRNDLSRIATIGSVCVPALFSCETYPTFHALTSTITGRLRAGRTIKDRIAALFPCGSIVGVPKIRALEILHDLEGHARGFYTGGLGRIAPDRSMRFNVAIRTAFLASEGLWSFGVGGGIVADSDPHAEYEEAILKSKILAQLEEDFELIETFLWSPDAGFVRLNLHLARLARSANALGFAFDTEQIKSSLDSLLCTRLSSAGCDQRVRLQLGRAGNLQIGATALDVVRPDPLRAGIASDRLDPGDPFLRHKTTRRRIYEKAFSDAAASGFDEAVLLNRRGELAEGSRSTIFIQRDGWLATPPLEAGILPGVLRQSLIDTGQAREVRLTLDDLYTAGTWFFGSSLRGLRRAVVG